MYLMDLWAEAKLVKWIQEEHSQFCKSGTLYNQLSQRGYLVILDNRKISPVKHFFAINFNPFFSTSYDRPSYFSDVLKIWVHYVQIIWCAKNAICHELSFIPLHIMDACF